MQKVRFPSIFAISFLLSVSSAAAQVDARVWVDNEPDYYDRGDRMDVSFAVSDDAYVAVVHVDTDGSLEFVYPQTPWDNEYVRGGQVHHVSSRGANNGWAIRSRSGIGYFYLIASPRPLDFSSFRGRSGSPWDWGYAGRTVRGDPFLAFEQITRVLIPGGYSQYVYDYYSYNVGGRHRYPDYACSDRYYDSGWGWTPDYGSCSQMDYYLRDRPYYYDTRRYRDDRRVYWRDYDRLDPRYGYKEDPGRPAARGATARDFDNSRSDSQNRNDDRYVEPRRDAVQEERDDSWGSGRSSAQPSRAPAVQDRGSTATGTGRARPTPEPTLRPADTGDRDASVRQPARGRP